MLCESHSKSCTTIATWHFAICKSPSSQVSDVIAQTHISPLRTRSDKLMEAEKEKGKSETFLKVRDFDRRPECRSLMRIENREFVLLPENLNQKLTAASSGGSNFESSSGTFYMLCWFGYRLKGKEAEGCSIKLVFV